MRALLCVYHSNCADGFGAAWVVREWARQHNVEVEFHPGVYGNPPPDVAGRDMVIVDFSFKRRVLEALLQSGDFKQANTILVIDHHETAQQELRGISAPGSDEWDGGRRGYEPKLWRSGWESWSIWPVRALFDMGRSGAGLTWDFFFPDKPRPPLINHIEDRDLWRFKLLGTREIQAALFSYPYDFEVWDDLMAREVVALADEGRVLERKHFKDTNELIRVTKRRMVIGGISVLVANIPHIFTSDAGHLMSKSEPFAACYWDTPDGRVFSLRSRDDGANVAEIAARYGGGGHAHAAGFRMPIGWEGDVS